MNRKPDIVSLKWVIGLMNTQVNNAEAALVEYGNNSGQKQALLRCMWAVHQVSSTLRALGMKKGEMLTMEMERTLNFLYKDKLQGERGKLAMGGLMQALKVIPAYLEHTENVRVDTGRGLEQFVNDLRRWAGEKPRPRAFFFYMDIPASAGISTDAQRASDDEIKNRSNVMLALYLEMAKQGLKQRKVGESMVTVARIARKMQTLFAGTEAERFWFVMIGLCEGMAGGLIKPDECIAQIFKAGAFVIKHARENGGQLDEAMDFDGYLQQMLYYIASCKSKPVHIAGIREVFGIDDGTLREVSKGLVHSDALITALSGALGQLVSVMEFFEKNDLSSLSKIDIESIEDSPLEAIEAAEYRLVAAGRMDHADSLKKVQRSLKQLFNGTVKADSSRSQEAVHEITRGIINVKLDLEHKLEYGLNSTCNGKEFELRESVATATFRQMSLVENYLHQILRRKALKSALDKKPDDAASLLRLTTALQRHLNKTDKGHEELRQLIREADSGEADLEQLYRLACAYQDQLDIMPDRKAIAKSLELLQDIADALLFAGMEREGKVMDKCREWLGAASDAGSVHEDDAFRCFADAFAQIEMHLQRSLLDPLDDTSHMMEIAEQRAAELDRWIAKLSPGRATTEPVESAAVASIEQKPQVQDAEIPSEFREVFIEESEEIVAELAQLTSAWLEKPELNDRLRDIRRHFHTFKGNGRAVGANILGELGWSAQDMLDRFLDGDLYPGETVQNLLNEVVSALPDLVESYSDPDGADIERIRKLTAACFVMASAGSEEQASGLPEITDVIGSSAGRVSEVNEVNEVVVAMTADTVTH